MRSHMLGFSQFLTEDLLNEAKGMSGNIGGEGARGLRHLKNYVMPYLSQSQRAEIAKNFAPHIKSLGNVSGHGEMYSPDTKNTEHHEIISPVNNHQPGTKVRITGARVDDQGKIFVKTAKHGEMQLSKLAPPKELKREQITKGGFEVEGKIAKLLGGTAAGSTGTAYDYSFAGDHPEGVRGKVRKLESDKPMFRGEAKQNKASMGTSTLKFNRNTKKWEFSHPEIGKHMAKAKHPESGLPILEHLNRYHHDGIIPRGITMDAPKGMARKYLNNLGVNSLHLHRTEEAGKKKQAIDHGTTFTIGNENPIAGKTKLGHLNDKDIDKLDGKITIESTSTGSTKAAHKPDTATFKEYADKSVTDPENHRSLYNEDHAKEFMQHMTEHLSSLNPEAAQTAATTAAGALNTARSRLPFKSKPKPKLGATPQERTISPIAAAPKPGLSYKEHTDGTHGGFAF